jgi:CheY-like chemotaxis protein
MDLRMPGIGGVEAIRRLQASGATAVHVAVTGSGLDGAAQDAIAAGAREVILKPYLEGDLLRRIGAQLGIRYACDDGPARRRVETAARAATARIPTARIPPAVTAQLSRLLSAVPHGLRAELLDAVVRARPQRIESLAAQIGEHSAEAAARIRALAQDFNYDGLSAALTAAAAAPITAGG